MKFNIFGWRTEFYKLESILEKLSKSDVFGTLETETLNGKGFLIFTTNTQHTWIVASDKNLYVVLDDLNKDIVVNSLKMDLNKVCEKLNDLSFEPISDPQKTMKGYHQIKFGGTDKLFYCCESLIQTKEDLIININKLIN